MRSGRPEPPEPADVAATYCATLVDEWVRHGVTDVIIAPGSRSTPLALSAAADGRLRVQVHPDERSAGFLALGVGLGSGRPALVVTTSGTAGVELHAAVVEAHQAGVALIVCTADRPPELQHVAAPQTIDQTHLYGRATRWFHEPGVADWEARRTWRPLAARAFAEASGTASTAGRPGPVHLNLAFREPLLGEVGALPPGRSDGRPWLRPGGRATAADPAGLAHLAPHLAREHGLIVAGWGCAGSPSVLDLASACGWPVLADSRSGLHSAGDDGVGGVGGAPGSGPVVVRPFDAVLRSEAFARDHRPDVVWWLGERPASKVLGRWVAATEATEVVIGAGRLVDPDHRAAEMVTGPIDAVAAELCLIRAGRGPSERQSRWLEGWRSAAESAERVIDEVLSAHAEPTEPALARATTAALEGTGADLVVSSSMPVRDVEWFARVPTGVRVLANRGANGIDGVVSTAVGVAVSNRGQDRPTVALLGDLAFLHDSNGLIGLTGRDVDLVLVVVDNDGGGIFSFLPQRTGLTGERFEQLFATPHGIDLVALAAVHHITAVTPTASAEVGPAVADAVAKGGVHLVLVGTDRAANVIIHDELHRRIAAGLPPGGPRRAAGAVPPPTGG